MKKIKLFSIVAAFVAAFAFASCNTGDDNNSYYQPLTQAEKDLCYLKTKGVYNGKLAYMSHEHVTEKGTKEYIDTLDVATAVSYTHLIWFRPSWISFNVPIISLISLSF